MRRIFKCWVSLGGVSNLVQVGGGGNGNPDTVLGWWRCWAMKLLLSVATRLVTGFRILLISDIFQMQWVTSLLLLVVTTQLTR